MAELTSFEKGLKDKANKVDNWLTDNQWSKPLFIILALTIGFVFPLLGVAIIIVMIILGLLLWNINNKENG